MAKAQKKTAKIKVKKKRWFPIYSPAFLGKKKIGESYLTEANVAVGREMKISLRDLTGSVRDQNVYVSLKVKSVSGSDLETEGIGYNYVPFFIKKMVKRRGARADESFITRTKEGKLIRIKTLVSTTFKVPHSTCTDLRAIVREALVDFANKSNLDVFLENLLRNKFQIETKKRLSKICPVKDVLV
ncbi:hypothetical protein HN747_05225, partial [archaeon]|nr:hypothetical protein [archaeon]